MMGEVFEGDSHVMAAADVAPQDMHAVEAAQEASRQFDSTVKLADLLDLAVSHGVSDIHFGGGSKISLRVNGFLVDVDSVPVLSSYAAEEMLKVMLTDEQWGRFVVARELDFSFTHDDSTVFRGNAFYRRGNVACVMRMVPKTIPTLSYLGAPDVVSEFGQQLSGLVIIGGPSGAGKSTTLAALVDEINHRDARHILTIENPVEFAFESDKSIFSQREIGIDTQSYADALKSAFREDCDVIMIGELRTAEEMGYALELAETGHLVFVTLHGSNVVSAISRFCSSFGELSKTASIRLADVLIGAVAQQLVSDASTGTRKSAFEVLVNTDRSASAIRSGGFEQLYTIMQTGAADGMITMEASLAAMQE